ncbi:hypothetical protein ACB098_04G165200 [Castanea mollissima]
MPETHPPENQLNGVVVGGPNTPLVLASSDTTTTTITTVGSKRQRRPSVRLGDIGGDQPYDSHVRRTAHNHTHNTHHNNNSNIISSNNNNNNNISNSNSKHWKLTMKDPTNSNSNSNSNSNNPISDVEEREGNLDSVAIGSWKVKDSKRRGLSAKRVRSNWVSRADECDIDDGYREFDVENSESPLKEQSPIHSLENLGVDGNERELVYRRPFRGGGGVRENIDGVELSGPSDSGDRNENGGGGRRGKCGEDGVRIWLNGLGLSRYAPVFEIHEVDDEVLPMLTLEDLKDMGINAVGSRRKMYCAIQKLGKGFS